LEGDPDTACAIVLRITPERHAALAGHVPPRPLVRRRKARQEINQAVHLGGLVEQRVSAQRGGAAPNRPSRRPLPVVSENHLVASDPLRLRSCTVPRLNSAVACSRRT
jgi:hypothetical protein